MLPSATMHAFGLRLLAVAAAAGSPGLLRSALHELVAGPIAAAHVLLAQVAFLLLAGAGARLIARTARRRPPHWRKWAVDAAGIAGAAALLRGAEIASGHRAGGAIDLEVMAIVVSAPIVEEIVYRGLLPGLLLPTGIVAPGLSRRIAVAVVASAAFAAAHASGDGYASAGGVRTVALSFGCGLAFHLLRDASGGLAASMAAHAGVNATSLYAMG